MRARLEELIRAKGDEYGRWIVVVEVMPGQVCLSVEPRPKSSLWYVAGRFKGFTSRRLRAGFPCLRSRPPVLWSQSHFAASAGAVSARTVRRRIETRCERAAQGGGRA